MGLSSSLNASVMGLNVNSTRISAISDNIANASTVGYKRATVDFQTLVNPGQRINSSSYTAGGVGTAIRRNIEASGSLTSTTNATDVAVSGQGFIPITPTLDPGDFNSLQDRVYLTSTGSFQPDEDGFLKNTSGQFMLGWPLNPDGTTVDDVSRDNFSSLEAVQATSVNFSADPTSQITFRGNLPLDETAPGASGDTLSVPVQYFGTLGVEETLDLEFTPTVSTGTDPSSTWTLTLTDSATAANGGVVAEYEIIFNDTAVNGGSIVSVTPAAGSAGTYDAASGELNFNVDHGDMSLFIGRPSQPEGLNQFNGDFIPLEISKDGVPFGSLSGYEVSNQGIIEALFDNGQRRPLYRVPLVNVVNPNSMDVVTGPAFSLTEDSGSFFLWDAGTGPVGQINGYALEQSTTDIAQELTSLIETQRAYSSNAKIVQTVDEMLQETTNLKR